MKSKLLLRIAAAFILIHLLGHTMGHLSWDKSEDPKQQEIINNMKSYKTDFMGAVKSIGDYYNGYSLILFFVYGMTIWILIVASANINEQRALISKLLLPVAITYMSFGVIEYISFFPFAASMSFLAGLCVMLAITIIKK